MQVYHIAKIGNRDAYYTDREKVCAIVRPMIDPNKEAENN